MRVSGGSRWWEAYSPAPKSAAERRILEVLRELQRFRWKFHNVPPEDGRLLRVLTEAAGARHVVEVGTANGYSGLWFCLALRATGGRLTTFEIDPEKATLARENFKRAGVADIATVVVGDAHEKVKTLKGPVDLAFLDADKRGYIDYLRKLLPLLRPGGLILAHNVNSHRGQLRDYIEAVTKNPDLETIFLHMDGPGMSVTLKKRG